MTATQIVLTVAAVWVVAAVVAYAAFIAWASRHPPDDDDVRGRHRSRRAGGVTRTTVR